MGLTKPIEQNKLSYQGTFMYLKNIIRGGTLMKSTKRCFVFYSFYDRTGIEAYLEKQAEKGWLLDKIAFNGWHFRRIEPQKLHFSVVYFARASVFDPEPSEAQLSFQDFCEHTGWKLAASNAQMQIFYNEAADPTPIETDATLDVAAIHASAKKSHLPAFYLSTFTGIFQMLLYLFRLVIDPLQLITSNIDLFMIIYWLLLLIFVIVEMSHYHSWHRKAKKAAEIDGSFVTTNSHPYFKIVMLGIIFLAFVLMLFVTNNSRLSLIAIASIVIVLGLTAILLGISQWMKKLKFSATANRNITIILTLFTSFSVTGMLIIGVIIISETLFPEKIPVATYEVNGWTHKIYHDPLPLTVEDLIETDYDNYSYEINTHNKSFLQEKLEATQRPCLDALDQPRLDYIITTVKCPFVYEWCQNAMLDNFAHDYGRPIPEDDTWEKRVKVDATPWNANEAYQLELGGELQTRFLLCYETCIVEIDLNYDGEFTDAHKKIISEKLGTP